MNDWEVTFVEFNDENKTWWTGLRPFPDRDINYVKYLSLPYGLRKGMVVVEVADGKYIPKKFEMEALVCTLAVKKASAYDLEKEINKMLAGYRQYGYVISGFHVTPAYGVVSDEAKHHTYYLITQATMRSTRPQKKDVVAKDVKPMVL